MGETLNDLLDRFFSEEGITEGEWALLEKEYGQAINSSPCPCKSEKSFEDCCKKLWNSAVRTKKANERDAKEQVKQTKRDGKQVRADKPTWLCKIGYGPDGEIIVVPLDGVPKELRGLQIMHYLSEVLHSAYHMSIMDIMRMTVQSGCQAVFKRITQPHEEESKGGIVMPGSH